LQNRGSRVDHAVGGGEVCGGTMGFGPQFWKMSITAVPTKEVQNQTGEERPYHLIPTFAKIKARREEKSVMSKLQ